jgi:hypothetical protein
VAQDASEYSDGARRRYRACRRSGTPCRPVQRHPFRTLPTPCWAGVPIDHPPSHQNVASFRQDPGGLQPTRASAQRPRYGLRQDSPFTGDSAEGQASSAGPANSRRQHPRPGLARGGSQSEPDAGHVADGVRHGLSGRHVTANGHELAIPDNPDLSASRLSRGLVDPCWRVRRRVWVLREVAPVIDTHLDWPGRRQRHRMGSETPGAKGSCNSRLPPAQEPAAPEAPRRCGGTDDRGLAEMAPPATLRGRAAGLFARVLSAILRPVEVARSWGGQ